MVIGRTPENVDDVFHALADATRRDMLKTLSAGEQSVSALARHYPMSFAAVHKHVGVLERARLVTKVRSGRESLVRCSDVGLSDARRALDALEQLWRDRVAQMDQILAADSQDQSKAKSQDQSQK